MPQAFRQPSTPFAARSAVARLVASAALTLLAAPVWAQVPQGDPLKGRELYEDTPNASGVPTLTSSCINCHTSVENRRTKIDGGTSVSPVLTHDQVMTKFASALERIGGMKQFKDNLSGAQIHDIAAYIADTPKVDATNLDFVATAVNTITPAKTLKISASVAVDTPLKVVSVEIAGTNAGRFTRTYNCDGASLAAAASCTVSVTFSSPVATTAAQTNPVLRVSMTQGASTTPIVRTVFLTGAVTGSSAPAPVPTTPAPTAPVAEDSGGGAIGWGWLAALALATVALGQRRRRA